MNFRPRHDLTHFSRDDVKMLQSLPVEKRAEFIAKNIEKAKVHYSFAD